MKNYIDFIPEDETDESEWINIEWLNLWCKTNPNFPWSYLIPQSDYFIYHEGNNYWSINKTIDDEEIEICTVQRIGQLIYLLKILYLAESLQNG